MTQAERLRRLFDGLDRVYGTYRVTKIQDNGKRVGDGPKDIATRLGKVDVLLWQRHLDGQQSIGVVPIRDDATCVFGAIDVDDYSLGQAGLAGVVKKADQLGLPLVPCRTKSGGAHLYLFAAEPVEARLFRERLSEMAAAMGVSGSEIFPKQERLVSEHDCGCWINMPYFGGLEGGRYGLTISADPIALDEFLDFAEGMRRPASFFQEPARVEGLAFADGPPCLQQLAANGSFTEGSRNILLYNAAIYCLRRAATDGSDHSARLHEINATLCRPPASRPEVDGIAASASKKRSYRYQCKNEPLASHCDGKMCRLRPYGVGRDGQGDGGGTGRGDGGVKNESFPRLGQLRMLKTVPPIWFWDTMSGRTIELTTEELQSPRLFQKRCMECIKQCPTMPSQQGWQTLVNQAMSTCLDIEAPEDASDEGQVWEQLEKFCTGKVQAQGKKEILLGKPWTDPDTRVTWFRLSDFKRHLDQQRFRGDMMKTNNLSALFHKRGLEKDYFTLDKKGNKGANVWGVQSFAEQPAMDVPPSVTDEGAPF